MDRRAFIGSLAAVGLLPTLDRIPFVTHTVSLKRGLYCTPFAPNGVQQCEAGIDSSILDVTAADRQHASQWCWAACIEAVFTYYGHPVAQETIVRDTWGDIVNMPGYPSQILGALNRSWTDDNGDTFRSFGSTVGTNPMTAAQDLAADHPLIIGSQGHATVLTSLTYFRDYYGNGQVTLAEVRDPWPYSPGHRALSAQEWYGANFGARIRVQG